MQGPEGNTDRSVLEPPRDASRGKVVAAPTGAEVPAHAVWSRRRAAQRWVDEHGEVLWKFCMSRLHDHAAAEEIVQETLLAGMQSFERFTGASSERTWLTGIASHKCADFARGRARDRARAGPQESAAPDAESTGPMYNSKGMWATIPAVWKATPEAELAALHSCIEKLPALQREALWLRDVSGVPSEEIRRALNVSATNLWTLLHRARMALRGCVGSALRDGGSP